jgi:eukaryotic-like serine/threonine-protein kinase
MPLQVVCPNPQCQKPMLVKDELAGQAVRCPACKATLSAVSRSDTPAASKTAKDPSTIQSISSAKESTSVARPARQSAPSESSGWGVPTMEATTAPPPRPSGAQESAGGAPGKASRGGQREEMPANIGPYQVSHELGRGAFGVVYKGHDPKLKRDVAIKVLNRNALHSTKAVERFLREAQVVAQMHHNHIIPVFELGEHEGCHYIASRFVPGKSLAELIPDQGMGAVEAVGLVLQLLEALTYAHEMNVLHRDVKPANAIVDAKGQLYLMDFGLAGWVGQTDGRATQDGTVMGTPSYMPPEQARGDINNVRETADQYSAGVVLYELLSGHVPFEGGPIIVLLHNVISAPPPRPSEYRADLDPQLEGICLKALEKTPEERYPSCHAFADALRTWKTVRGSPIPIAVSSIVEPRLKMAGGTQAAFIKPGAKTASWELSVGTVKTADVKEETPDVPPVPVIHAKQPPPISETPPSGARDTLTEESLASGQPRRSGAIRKRRPPPVNSEARKKWLIGSGIGVGVLLLALLGLWASGVFRLKTAEVILVVEVNEPEPDVYVDGDKVTVTWGKDGKRAEVRLKPGTRKVELKKDDFTTISEEVELQDGKRRVLTARLVSRVSPAGEYDLTGGRPFVHFGPDGIRVVLRGNDATEKQFFARVYDLASTRALSPPIYHDRFVEFAWFSPDGTRVITGSGDSTAGAGRVWDAVTGQPVTRPLTHDKALYHASFSPDGKRVVTASGDGTARVWDAQTGQPITPSLRHVLDRVVLYATFSPDGKRVVTAGAMDTGRVWDAQTGQPITPPLKHDSMVKCAVFSPDSKRIVSGSWDSTARVWDAQTGQLIAPLLMHDQAWVFHASFSPDGKRVLTTTGESPNPPSGDNKMARVWDAETGQTITPPLRHEKYVIHASFSPDGARVVTASGDNTARVWDAVTGQPLTPALKHDGFVTCATFSPDGRWVVTASEDHTARLWDAKTGQELKKVTISLNE